MYHLYLALFWCLQTGLDVSPSRVSSSDQMMGWDANTSVDYKTDMARADNWELMASLVAAVPLIPSDLLFSVKKLGLLTLTSLSHLLCWLVLGTENENAILDINLGTVQSVIQSKLCFWLTTSGQIDIIPKVNLNNDHIHRSRSNIIATMSEK